MSETQKEQSPAAEDGECSTCGHTRDKHAGTSQEQNLQCTGEVLATIPGELCQCEGFK